MGIIDFKKPLSFTCAFQQVGREKWSHSLNWYPNNVCKMPFVVPQDIVHHQAFVRMTMKAFVWKAICYLCSDLPCSCCEGTFCLACWKLSHSEPCKQANWLALKLWLFSTILQRPICSKELWNSFPEQALSNNFSKYPLPASYFS